MIDLTRHIRPGDTVLVGGSTGEPRELVAALIAQRHELRDVSVFTTASFTGLFKPEHADALRFIGLGGVGSTSALTSAGALDVLPAHLGEMTRLMSSGRLRFDVVFAQMTQATHEGHHSLGSVSDYLQPAIAAARVTLAELNPNAPFTFGDTLVHPGDIDEFVVNELPLIVVPRRPPTPEDVAIGGHIAALIPDGATLQIGVGGTPDAVMAQLGHARHLGVHSGLMTDSLADMIEAGIITNERKEIDQGVSVTGALYGTTRLYGWADRQEALRMRLVSYTHNPRVLAQLGSLFSINSAIEVDLTGQINGEVAGERYLGTVGGQGYFARAATTSDHGRSIIALPSTGVGGTVSRIVADIASGVVTTARSDADLIVTEHGVADLRGATLSQRALRLIAIADPKVRDELASTPLR